MVERDVERVPAQALRLWRGLAGEDDALAPGTRTVVRGARGFCQDGWTGVVRLGDAVAVEAGEASDEQLRVLLALPDPTDLAAAVAALRPADTLGPGVLHHLPEGATPAVPGPGVARVDRATLASWVARLPTDDVAESDVDELDVAWVVRRDGEVAGAAGWLPWPDDTAHLGVLVAPAHRGVGIGTRVGAAATAAAVAAGLHPQWRAAATNPASCRAASRIGYVATGAQLVLDLRVG